MDSDRDPVKRHREQGLSELVVVQPGWGVDFKLKKVKNWGLQGKRGSDHTSGLRPSVPH